MVCVNNGQFIPGTTLILPAFHGTEGEKRALMACVIEHLGPCDCHPSFNGMTGKDSIHVCNGHWFLRETDGLCNRPDRLLFARRMKMRWQSGEFGHLLPRPDDEESLGW